ncbi:hypothetical protein CFIMG_003037RAa [Ceratocystis fimbriata CBS 114723]|uniref:PXA domain-containing protein n=1 Tax=Ceratocystis fimbriata CBS 114723 TaxID=1035309 RepID=A0A2C5XAV6_9PEZI|nr:hypothetical protein CFIMG_003037RAa [Ceratocystis fimbriata CBS 114723]
MVALSAHHNPLSARTRLPGGPMTANKTPPTQSSTTALSSSRRTARPVDPLGERATAQLIRRVLLPQQHSDQLTAAALQGQLPPLTSSNEVDFEIYALIAIVLRDFVQTWYSKITPDDAFVAELVNIMAHISRAMEQRVRKVDLESLFLDEIPYLLEQHIIAYRASKRPAIRPPVEANSRQIYHSLFPSPAMAPVPETDNPESISTQVKNEVIYRKLLVQGMLAVLLPTEDFQSSCLTSLVGEIISESIIGNIVSNKISQPWMLWEIMGILCSNITRKEIPSKDKKKRRKETPDVSPQLDPIPMPAAPSEPKRWSFPWMMITLVQWGVALYSIIRGVIHGFMTARKLPSRARHQAYVEPSKGSSGSMKVPIITWKLFTCAGTWIEIDERMPWLSGNIALLQWGLLKGPWNIGAFDGVLDRYVSSIVSDKMLDGSKAPGIIKAIRGSLFPNNLPGKPSLFAPTNKDEEKELRLRTSAALVSLMPKWMLKSYFCGSTWEKSEGSDDSFAALLNDADSDQCLIQEIDKTILDVFSDEYCNKHLIYAVLELVLVRLLPELAEKGVEDLLDDRLGI